MQKLTLSVDDDIYALLHKHIGRGNIGRFVCDAVRPHLLNAADKQAQTAFGALSHLAKAVDAESVALAKRRYLEKRHQAKQS
jgi:hypothetical protein